MIIKWGKTSCGQLFRIFAFRDFSVTVIWQIVGLYWKYMTLSIFKWKINTKKITSGKWKLPNNHNIYILCQLFPTALKMAVIFFLELLIFNNTNKLFINWEILTLTKMLLSSNFDVDLKLFWLEGSGSFLNNSKYSKVVDVQVRSLHEYQVQISLWEVIPFNNIMLLLPYLF